MKQTTSFLDLGLSQASLNAIEKLGFTEPSPIQNSAIPKLMKGHDLIGQAQTGTGKTAAFGIPILESITEHRNHISSLVLCPTRELALQVSRELQKLAGERYYIRILAVFGGDSIQKQIRSLKDGVDIVVGTPGRIKDLMSRKILILDKVSIAVMDEADEMLNMGFRDDMEDILSTIPDTRQTVLFSATMPPPILDIAKKYLKKPLHAKVTGDVVTNASIEQLYYEVSIADKPKLISCLVRQFAMKSVIVFTNTKKAADETVLTLRRAGLKSDAIHGDLGQSQRNQVLNSFRHGNLGVLVATDVAARGIDVSNVDAVFNYDIPMDREGYVHRVGRTGRAGKSGKAISFVSSSSDLRKIRSIESFSRVTMAKKNPPTSKEIRTSYVNQMKNTVDLVNGSDEYKHHIKLAEEILESGIDINRLLAYYLKENCPLDVVEPSLGVRESKPSRDGGRSSGNFRQGQGARKKTFQKSGSKSNFKKSRT
jgi:ATP-dependent RNA helicase DeaD